jgi:hypothetical protein
LKFPFTVDRTKNASDHIGRTLKKTDPMVTGGYPKNDKTDRHDITEILLKVALNTIKPNQIFKIIAAYVYNNI